jgi:hypothetical protein
MKSYPSISKTLREDIYIYAFDKLDGSSIRAEWNSKRGFYKFGTRTQLIDSSSNPFGIAIQIIKDKYENDLSLIFKEQKWKDVICFFELYGPSSFAGTHNFNEKLTVTLFDVNPFKQGILEPKYFINYFSHLDIPKILFEGKITSELLDKIKQSTLSGMTYEGVVCKGSNDKATKMPIMFKIKSQIWLNKLKIYCKDNIILFEQLA